MSKLNIRVTEFKPVERNTLQGFCTIRIAEMRLTIHDIAVHQKGAERWCQLPSKPQLSRDGVALRDRQTGKILYATLLEFDSKAVRDAFNRAVIAALLDFNPHALRNVEAAA